MKEEHKMDATPAWQQQREQLNRRVEELRQAGIGYTCHDLRTGELFGDQQIVYEDEIFRIALEPYPRARGHTIVVYKPHREDISQLSEEEACSGVRSNGQGHQGGTWRREGVPEHDV